MKKTIALLLLLCLCLVPVLASCRSADENTASLSKASGVSADEYILAPSIKKMNTYSSSNIVQPVIDVSTTDEKLVITCSIRAETKEYDKTLTALDEAVTATGGYVESRRSNGSSYGSGTTERTLSLVARIPSAKINEFNQQVGGLVNVVSFSSNVENVTEAYTDSAARLEVLKTERASLLAMMETLTTSKEYEMWLTLERRISDLEQSIASLEATLRNLDNKVDYSTVTIELSEVVSLTDTTENTTFWDDLGDTFSESWSDFADGILDFFLFLVSAIPTLLILAGLFCAVFFPIRHHCRKKKRAATASDVPPTRSAE